MEVNPLSIILVKSDSKGDRLLFRYPYEADLANDINDQRNGKRNPYALSVIEDLLQTPMPQTSNILKGINRSIVMLRIGKYNIMSRRFRSTDWIHGRSFINIVCRQAGIVQSKVRVESQRRAVRGSSDALAL